MMQPASAVPIGLLASGGLDSCILLASLLHEGRRVQPFYVRCGLAWEVDELAGLRRFLAALADRNGQSRGELAELVVLEMPLADLYAGHWSVTGREVPDHATPDDAVFLPGRNALLVVKPAIWCQLHGIKQLALATLRSNPFPDATEPFFAALGAASAAAAALRWKSSAPSSGSARPTSCGWDAATRSLKPFRASRCAAACTAASAINARSGSRLSAPRRCPIRPSTPSPNPKSLIPNPEPRPCSE